MDILSAPQPKYLQIAKTLISEIQGGTYPIGTLLATEHQLCEQFGASRFTVRQAIGMLVERGLVIRQPRIGTKIVATHATPAYRQVMQRLEDVRRYAADTKLVVLETNTIEVDEQLTGFLAAKAGETWLHATGIRRGPGSVPPVCFVEIFINPLFRAIRGLKTCANVPVYSLIEQQFGEHIVELRHELRATSLDARLAERLDAEPGSPAMIVDARYFNHRGDLVQASISTHPADRFSYVGAFRRDWSGEAEESPEVASKRPRSQQPKIDGARRPMIGRRSE